MECQAGRAAKGLEAQETRLEKMAHGAEEEPGKPGATWCYLGEKIGEIGEILSDLKISKVFEPGKIFETLQFLRW